MQDRYWMFQRNGVFYAQDKLSGKQKSLKTRDAAAAQHSLLSCEDGSWLSVKTPPQVFGNRFAETPIIMADYALIG